MLPPEVLVPLVYGPVLVFVAFAIRATHQRRTRAWKEAAHHLGLKLVYQGGLFADPRLVGEVDGFPVEIRVTGGRHPRTRILVKGLVPGLSLRAESLGSGLKKLITGEDIQLGDGTFDDAALVEGDPLLAHALLGHKARTVATHALDSGATFQDGTLSNIKPGVTLDPARLEAATKSLVALAQHLRARQDLPAALEEHAAHDPVSGVREACLRTLLERYPRSAHSERACRQALRDNAAAVRLKGAMGLGAEGVPTLKEIAGGESLPAPLRTTAIAVLEQLGSIVPLLPALLETADREVRRVAISATSRSRERTLLPAMQRLIGAAEAEERAEIARAIGELGSAESTGTLLRLLALPETVVIVAAAKALGKVGDLSAVAPLKEIAEGGLLTPGEVKTAASDAIKAIQARQVGAEAGQLAISGGDEAGALSLSQREAGALSIAAALKRSQ